MTTKTLKDLFEVYKPKAPDEQKFVDKHVTIKHKDRNGNGDDVFNATNIKTIERKKEGHGYDSGEDEKVYEEVEDLEELSSDTLRRYRMKSKAIGDNEKGDINYRSKGRDLAARKTHGGQWGIPKAKVMAKEEVEQLEEGTMKLSKVHIVHHHDHPAAKEFAKHYTEGMKGEHREGGPTEKDEAASNKFHERYSGMTTRHGFAGSGTTIYHDHKTGAQWKVDRHPNGKTFYGTDHIISHHTPNVNESVDEEIYFTDLEEAIIRGVAEYYSELGEEVDLETIGQIAEELIDELSVKTLDSYRTKARKDLIDADANDDNRIYNKRAKGYRAASKSVSKKFAKEEVEELDELSTATLQSYRKKARAQGNAIVDKMKVGGGDWSKDQKDTKTLRKRAAGAQASGKQLVKRGESLKTEEAEQIDELSKNTLRSYVDKRATQRDLTSHDIVRKNIAAASGVKPRNKPESAASTRSYYLAINKIVKDKDSPDRPKVLATEEAEQIDELSKATLGSYIKKAKTQMSRSDTVAGRLAGERMKGGKPSAQERKHSDRANKRYFGIDKAVDKLTKEEVEQLDELSPKTLGSYVSKAARSAGSNIAGAVASGMANGNKDDQRSMGRNYAKRLKGIDTAAKKLTKEEVINRVVEKYVPEVEEVPLDEQLVAKIENLSENHIHMILALFETLNEDNQKNLIKMVDAGRVNEVLDFAIESAREVRGE